MNCTLKMNHSRLKPSKQRTTLLLLGIMLAASSLALTGCATAPQTVTEKCDPVEIPESLLTWPENLEWVRPELLPKNFPLMKSTKD